MADSLKEWEKLEEEIQEFTKQTNEIQAKMEVNKLYLKNQFGVTVKTATRKLKELEKEIKTTTENLEQLSEKWREEFGDLDLEEDDD